MGWNQRQGKAYFYTSYRDTHGRVRTKYIGTGATAQAVASRINKSRQDRKQQYTDRLRARQQFDELNKLIKRLLSWPRRADKVPHKAVSLTAN